MRGTVSSGDRRPGAADRRTLRRGQPYRSSSTLDDGPAVRNRHRSVTLSDNSEPHFGGGRVVTTSDTRRSAEEARACTSFLLNGKRGLALARRRVSGGRKRLQTPRGLESVFGVAPRFGRIDTLKCRKAMRQRVFGRRGNWPSKHMRGGLLPNGRTGRPRRGQRSREHRLDSVPNRALSRTDAQSEQSSEVAGSSLSKDAPTGLSRTVRAAMRAPYITPRQRS
jgi:hypothetical protein